MKDNKALIVSFGRSDIKDPLIKVDIFRMQQPRFICAKPAAV